MRIYESSGPDGGLSVTGSHTVDNGWRALLVTLLAVVVFVGLFILAIGLLPATGAAGGCGGG